MFFTSAASGDLRPSFFEMYAQDRLVVSLRPAVKFALEVLAVRQPRLFRIIPRADEIFLGLHLILELSSLRRSDGTIAEQFYSLRRSPTGGGFDAANVSTDRLRQREILSSLISTVFIPYLKEKLDDIYEKMSGGSAERLLRSSRATRTSQSGRFSFPPWKTLFLKVYAVLSSAYDLSHFVYNLLYLFERSSYFTPLLHLQGRSSRKTLSLHPLFETTRVLPSLPTRRKEKS